MKKFAIDESGYTGCDFLNETQMWQGACAIDISYDDARHLIRQHFPKLQAPELKFSSLKRGGKRMKSDFFIYRKICLIISRVLLV